MKIRVPVGFQPLVGQKQEFRVVGYVETVERDPTNGQWLATINVEDPLIEAEQGGFSPLTTDRRIMLREEMYGGVRR
jgi:hypothetical protein